MLPQFSGEASIQTNKQSLNEGYPSNFASSYLPATIPRRASPPDLDWQLDFFGRKPRGPGRRHF